MTSFASSPVTAVLGPTNTGKTHLAIERMVAHSSGIIGFPLRLLAREVYDRVVAIKGANQVALITGEEKILPADARWFLCTAESMPTERDVAFVALDEAQLAADLERGHVFTDRLLHARGREETMILGSESLRPIVKTLVRDAEIISRPRFSTLSFAGTTKISRLPRRSAIVAFSAEEVYAVAELLRRLRGGAAVVMGALSPRTRNAQVAMFQAGEVDYLVATDAIGMGLNMDVSHVAFASLSKFDGRRQRRLTIAEMAQIAGRAGRHQRDGTFGQVSQDGPGAFTAEEIEKIEDHRFQPLDHVYWREGAPDFSDVDSLIASLEERPDHPRLRAAPEATDLAVLKRLAGEGWVRARASSWQMVARLWAACSLPDFRKIGVEPFARFVARLFDYLSQKNGHVPHDWFAREIARLDNVQGDVETLAGRIAATRSWAYIAHRADWLAEPANWAERTREIEERLSDALHTSLTQRFVDKRTTALMRSIDADMTALPVIVAADGEVTVEEHRIGRLEGFRFIVAPEARHADKKLLLAAAEKRLVGERARRGAALAQAADDELELVTGAGEAPGIAWQEQVVAMFGPGPSIVRPRVNIEHSLDCLERALHGKIRVRLEQWTRQQIVKRVRVISELDAIRSDPAVSPALRAVAAALLDAGAQLERARLGESVDTLDAPARRRLRQAGITIGTLDLFDARLLKPDSARWRAALIAAKAETRVPTLPSAGATVLPRGDYAGFRTIGAQSIRLDLVERLARAAHDARHGKAPFAPDPALAISIGLAPETLGALMRQLGFRAVAASDGAPRWQWRGRPRRRAEAPAVPKPANAFAVLADWGLHGS